MYETLLFSIENNIATLSFNRPEMMNCFNKKMGDELEIVTEKIFADNTIRAVVLKGEGALFMAGGDIHFFHALLENMPAGVMKIVRTLNASICNLMHMPKPIVACVHGSVAGVGMSLMMACDLVIAADNTQFTMAYSGIGVSPDGGASFNLPRLVGPKKAMEWMLLPDLFDAKTACSQGLINWCVSPDKLAIETNQLLERLAKGPTRSYACAKKLINQTWHCSLETQLEQEGRAFEACSVTSDFKSGVTSFVQRKRPVFTGK